MEAVPRPLRVAVVGGARAEGDALERAQALGAALGRAGAVLVCGGRGGVMEAAARGAAGAGGLTVGLLPGADESGANPWVALPLPTGLGEARNALVATVAEAVVAVGGGWGTLSEVAFARKAGRPVALLGPPAWPALDLPAFDDPVSAAAWAVERARARRGEISAAG